MTFAEKFSKGKAEGPKQNPLMYKNIGFVKVGIIAYYGVEYSPEWHDLTHAVTQVNTTFDVLPNDIEYSYKGYPSTP